MSDVKTMSLDDLENHASKFDWKAFDQTTEADIERHMIEDGEDPSVPFDFVYRRVYRDILHPKISEEVRHAFNRGDFAEAVFTAMRAVEIAVRKAGKLKQKQVGVKLMQAAFGKSGPLRNPEADDAEEEGLMHLFIGAMGSYKNPHSHRNAPLDDAGEAMEIVTLASHLLRIVDVRRSMLPDQDRHDK